MKNIFKIAGALTLAISIYSCSDSYFDVNTPSNAVPADKIAMKDVLSPCIQYTMNAQFNAASNIAQVDQHITTIVNDRQGIDNQYLATLDGYWRIVYTQALPNIQVLEQKAIATNSSHYLGIAKVLKAINIGTTTDLYGDIPYSESLLGTAALYPKYDSQQAIYTEIIKLLDESIALFSAPNTSTLAPGSEDLIYQGKIANWTKAAYTFKARFQLHLSKINGATTTANAVLASLSKGFTSNADDFQLKYNSVNINPWYSTQVGLFTGNVFYAISNHFISYMNGSVSGVFPFTSPTVTMDPRMPLLVDMRSYSSAGVTGTQPVLAAGYVGTTNGTGTSSSAKIGTQFFYSKVDAPLVYLSFSEAKFMEAEAQFLLAGGTPTTVGTNAAANAAYLAGIGANMDKIGIAAADKNAYIADASITKGAAALELKDIMRQKFIALFLNPETFTDYRRYDFSTNAFKNLKIPVNTDPVNGGKWMRRIVYSTNERSANAANYSANFKPMVTPVWWDK
ncbi:MAG: SusD/RagB family nutrient-binding outer membrane lipoprotein [Crocinitomicaceae bacterium]|nr:SusD/RagB family nutrient-binding outer membrane lipoprotein [Crocinitomicaceae bacterium]